MTAHLDAPGFPADWLNGWLAAVGVTVLVPGARLAWTTTRMPTAELVLPGDGDPATQITTALPTVEELRRLSTARRHPDASEDLGFVVSPEVFSQRARLARVTHDRTLEAAATDIDPEKNGTLRRGPLNPPAPRGTTLHDRLLKSRELLGGDPAAMIADSLNGLGRRVEANGLGFDYRRFPAGVHSDTAVFVDPVVELLAFYGLLLLPVRPSQRGWTKPPSRRHAFTWPTWKPLLDCWAIDALLDVTWSPSPPAELNRLGLTGLYGSVALQPKGSSDVGRGYASERLW